jgi:eukaryotic-like serine/threonine-protein kinase
MTEESIFLTALEKRSPEERQAFLEEACGADVALRARVQLLLEADARTRGILERRAPAGDATSAFPAATMVGTIIAGRYKLLEAIGEGGMGTVWVAEQTEPVRRKVALKLIKPGMDSKSVLARFEAERQALAVMDHPNIAKVLDGGIVGQDSNPVAAGDRIGILSHSPGRPFFVMEYVKGVPITEYCDAARLSVPERLQLFVQVCSAVQHAHQKGIIHRDLKPSNILVAPYDDKPVPKVIDFGLAKAMHQSLTERTLHTAHETVLGTPLYMSPEQAQLNNLDVDTRSDIYSLGVLLYELLTGTTPLEKKRLKEAAWDEVRRIIREEEPPRPSKRLSSTITLPSLAAGRQTDPARLTKLVRGELDWIVMKSLEKDRARRYETANGFGMDIQRYLAGEPVLAVPPSASYRLRKFARKHRAALTTAAAITLLLGAGVMAVVAVQVRANRDLAAKNAELADEQAKVQARFELAQKAIAMFHTGVSEDVLLKNEQFKELRTKLLKQAANFYADLEKLLAGQTDAKSRQALAAAYFQLGELTYKIGDKQEALAVHRKALALRRELAAAEGADGETRLDLARSLRAEGLMLFYTGDPTGALRAWEEQRDIATALEAQSATDAVRAVLAQSHNAIGYLLAEEGKSAEAHQAHQKALAIRQKLADANPAVPGYQNDLAATHCNMGHVLSDAGKPEEALTALRKALAIWQKLADANPAVAEFQDVLAMTQGNLASVLVQSGKPEEALEAAYKSMGISQKLADDNPAVTDFRYRLASGHDTVGWCLLNMGKPVEGAEASRKALAIMQKLVDDHPVNTQFQLDLASFQTNLGRALDRQKRSAEALSAMEAGLVLRQKLAKTDPNNANYSQALGESHTVRGGARARAGKAAEAAADLRRALELYAKLPALAINGQVDRSRALALLAGLGGDAKSGVTAAEAAAFADQAVAALADAFKAGWAQFDELKEPDFDPLRGREDLQKLVKELEAKASMTTDVVPSK